MSGFDDFLKQQNYKPKTHEEFLKEMQTEQAIPEGQYEATVDSAEFKQVFRKTDNEEFNFVEFMWKIKDRKQQQSFNIGDKTYGPDNMKRVERLIHDLGCFDSKKSYEQRLADCVGKKALVTIKHKMGNNGKLYVSVWFNELLGMKAPDAEPAPAFDKNEGLPF